MNRRTLKWVVLLGTGSITCQLLSSCGIQLLQLVAEGLLGILLQNLVGGTSTTP
jgi:hypothetical protein